MRYGKDEIIVEIPSKGSHWILTSFQLLKPTEENIRLLKNYQRAVNYIIIQKTKELKQLKNRHGEINSKLVSKLV